MILPVAAQSLKTKPKLMLFLDKPPESYSQRVKLKFNGLASTSSQTRLKNDIDSILEGDDFMRFSGLLSGVSY
jgi:hypothetical protein